jgi:monothiol glutaredoxin
VGAQSLDARFFGIRVPQVFGRPTEKQARVRLQRFASLRNVPRGSAKSGLTRLDLLPTLEQQTSPRAEGTMDAKQFIEQTVTTNPVVLFMKGTSQFPQCGFSGRAIQILKSCGVKNLVTVNVLDDDDVRQGVKAFANWPTIPQLYVKGQFVGGSDIMGEMFENGELVQLLKQAEVI